MTWEFCWCLATQTIIRKQSWMCESEWVWPQRAGPNCEKAKRIYPFGPHTLANFCVYNLNPKAVYIHIFTIEFCSHPIRRSNKKDSSLSLSAKGILRVLLDNNHTGALLLGGWHARRWQNYLAATGSENGGALPVVLLHRAHLHLQHATRARGECKWHFLRGWLIAEKVVALQVPDCLDNCLQVLAWRAWSI